MPLFVAQHQHSPEHRSSGPEPGPRLLSHVSAANAARYRVAIQAEAVIDDEHRYILLLEAPDRQHVERFMAFFTPFGSVQVLAASTAEEAIERGGWQ